MMMGLLDKIADLVAAIFVIIEKKDKSCFHCIAKFNKQVEKFQDFLIFILCYTIDSNKQLLAND